MINFNIGKDMEDDEVWIRIIRQDDPLELESSRQLNIVYLPHLELISTCDFDLRRVCWTHDSYRTSSRSLPLHSVTVNEISIHNPQI